MLEMLLFSLFEQIRFEMVPFSLFGQIMLKLWVY